MPVVLISPTIGSDANMIEIVQWAGADTFIREPVEPVALVTTVRRVLAP